MSAVEDLKPNRQNIQLKENESIVKGKITRVREIETAEGTLYLTLVRLPAPNEFEHPALIEIRSYASLGKPDDQITRLVRLVGVPNNYKVNRTNKKTGEIYEEQINSARNEFFAPTN